MNAQRAIIQCSIFCLLAMCLFASQVFAADQGRLAQVDDKSATIKSLHSMSLAFTQNAGQWPDSILYRANAGGATMWFTTNSAYYQLTQHSGGSATMLPGMDEQIIDRSPEKTETMLIRAGFVGSNPAPRVTGVDQMEYKCNYFLGSDRSRWQADVPNYQAMVYEDIYPGINLKYYGNGREMEYDFLVSPGSDYSKIQVAYEGARSIAVNASGELVIETEFGSITERRPVVYQTEFGAKKELVGQYVIADGNRFSFKIEGYNPALPLVIDPVLVYSTYLGGSAGGAGGFDDEHAFGIAVDALGSAYVAGRTPSADFPTYSALDGTFGGGTNDGFVTKLSPDGSSLVYSTFLGGNDDDLCLGIAVDSLGDAYIIGATGSADFPTQNAYDNSYNGYYDAFVVKLASGGNSLIYSTYLGGSGNDYSLLEGADECGGIAIDRTGNAYVTGVTASSDFPVVNAYDNTYDGTFYDVFVTKVSPNGGSLVYSTYIGGSSVDISQGLAVDSAGNAFVSGSTESLDFPVLSAFQSTRLGYSDAFVTKLAPAGSALIYSTLLGGSRSDWGFELAIDAAGSAYLAGQTYSPDFPLKNQYQGYQGVSGHCDASVTKLGPNGDTLVYSTYLGGADHDFGVGIAVNSIGNAYLAAGTVDGFPTAHAYDNTFNGGYDVVIAELGAAGNTLLYSTYLGGTGLDFIPCIAIDGAGNAYVAGTTFSSDFPTLNAYDNTLDGACDAFVAKLSSCGGDADGDFLGDECDDCTDTDGDGLGNPGYAANICTVDNCPDVANADQADADHDGIGDACDLDNDGDGIDDATDNCPTISNPTQADANSDGIGDACCCIGVTGNVNYTGIVDLSDLSSLVSYLTGGGYVLPCPDESNVNGIGIVDLSDLSSLVSYLTGGGYVLPACGATPAPVAQPVEGASAELSAQYDGKVTTVYYSAPYAVRAVQVDMSGDLAVAPTNLLTASMDVFHGRRENRITVILIDTKGKAVVEGKGTALFRVPGKAEIVDAQLADLNHNTVIPRISNSSGPTTLPSGFRLDQNNPNPFNPTTEISFSLPTASAYTLTIYNVTGQKIAEYSGTKVAGRHTITFDGQTLASGVYLYRLVAGDFQETKKMLLLK